jgi:acyl carrier protein
LKNLTPKKAFDQMTELLNQNGNVCMANINWRQFTSYFKQLASIDLFSHLLPKTAHVKKVTILESKAQFDKYFTDIIAQTLKLESSTLLPTQNLFSMGLNSMLSMYIRQALEQELQLKTEPTLFFQRQTIELLVDYLWEEYQNISAQPMDVTEGKIAFLFSGQGTQYAKMGSVLYENNSSFRQAVDECMQFLKDEFGLEFKSILFEDDSSLLKQTQYAQLALFITEYALYGLWEKKE